MLDLWERWIQFHELKLESKPVEADYIPLSAVMPLLLARIRSGESVKLINKDTAALRIAKYRHFKKQDVVVLLIQYADQNVTDPTFLHLEKGELRIEPKLDGEGVAVSAHVAISLQSHDDIGIMYRFLLEEIPGLGRSKLTGFIKSEFKAASQGMFQYKDEQDNYRIKNSKPVAEILGTPSKDLSDELEEGVILQGIELVKLTPENQEFDEEGYYSESSRHIRIIPDKDGSVRDIIERVRRKALKYGYEDVKIRYKKKAGKQKTAAFGATMEDLADALIVKDEKVTSDETLSQCMNEISSSIATKMVSFIVDSRPAERE